MMFFRGVQGFPTVSIQRFGDAIEPDSASADPGQAGFFRVSLSDSLDSSLTVVYRLSGTARYGSDYTNSPNTVITNADGTITGTLTIEAFTSVVFIEVGPKEDNFVEFEEPVTLTLVLTNGYLVNPLQASATITINDNFGTNDVFTTVATDLVRPTGIDYHPPTQSLIVSVESFNDQPFNFVRIDTNGVVTSWSTISGLADEVKLATAKTTANGFTNGQMFFGNNGVTNRVGWLSADGTVSNMTFATLTNDTFIRGSLYVDQSGSFGGDLIAVTGNGEFEGGGVWRITSSGSATNLANITNTHLEGVITLTNDVQKWGPLAGKIIGGAESALAEDGITPRPLIHAIDANGTVTSFALGIAPEDFDIIPPNQDLYCTDQTSGSILKLSSTLLTNYWGDLLITQEGFSFGSPKLFIVHWDGTNFVTRSISNSDLFEHVTFAPINLPSQ